MKNVKTAITLILLMLIFNATIWGQIQVGNETHLNKNLPVGPNYGYSYSQQIYYSYEIGSADTITKIKFYYAGTAITNSSNWTIYMAHTSKNDFNTIIDWVPASSLTQVYSGTITASSLPGWITIDITDFYFNGNDNIIIAVDENSAGYDQGSSESYYSTTIMGNRSIEAHSNSTNINPASPPTGNLQAEIANIIFETAHPPCQGTTGQTAGNTTQHGATLHWNGNNSTHYDIYITPHGGTAPVQATVPTFNDITGDSLVYNNGNSKTVYDWYIRTDCGQNNSYTSSWSGPYNFTTSGSCGLYKVSLTDSYGDGWNGSHLDVYVNGAKIDSNVTLSSGYGPESFFYPVDSGDIFTVDYTGQGASYENEYKIYDHDGNLLVDEGTGNNAPGDVGNPAIPTGLTTCPGCPDPYNLHTTAIYKTGATIAWSDSSGSHWDVYITPHGNAAPTSSATPTGNDLSSTHYTYTGGSTNTAYDAWVRTDCGQNNTNTGSWSGPLYFNTAGSCGLFRVVLYDSYADGWNGATLSIYVNGVLKESNLTLLTGAGPQTTIVPVDSGDIVSFSYTAGSFPYENSYRVYDHDSNLIAEEGAGNATPGNIGNFNIPSGLTSCPSCPAPTGQSADSLTPHTATLHWISAGSSYFNVEWGSQGFTTGTGNRITIHNDTFAVITGLTPNTAYSWYVRDSCSATDTSTWKGPFSFTTSLANQALPVFENFENGFTWFENKSSNTTNFILDTAVFKSSHHNAYNSYTYSNTNILEQTGVMNLTATTHPVVTFWHIALSESYTDKCFVEISTDGGQTYQILNDSLYLGNSQDYGTYNYFHEASYSSWYGQQAVDNSMWRKESFDLTPFKQNNVRLRFRIASDPYTNNLGWYIDDIKIYEPLQYDASVTGIYRDSTNSCSDSSLTLLVDVENKGFTGQSNVLVTAVVSAPDGTIDTVNQTLTSLPALNSATVNMGTIAYNNPGAFQVTAYVTAPLDLHSANDTLSAQVQIFGAYATDHVEDFETYPVLWNKSLYFTSKPYVGNPGKALYFSTYGGQDYAWTSMRRKIGPLPAGARLVFDYSIVDTTHYYNSNGGVPLSGDSVRFRLSDDCGWTYSTVYQIDMTNHDSTASGWVHRSVAIDTVFTGKTVNLGITFQAGVGNYLLLIDNLGIVAPAPFSLGADQAVCPGDSVIIGVTANNNFSYQWLYNNNLLPDTTAAIYAKQPGSYILKRTSAYGLTNSDTIAVTQLIPATVTVSSTGANSLCRGDSIPISVTLTGSSPWSFTMTENNTPTTYNLTSLPWVRYLKPVATTTYVITSASNGNGCVRTDSLSVFTITVNNVPSVSVTGFDSAYCENAPADTLTGYPAGGSFTGGSMTGNIYHPQMAISSVDQITYSYTNAAGCQADTTLFTNILPYSVVGFSGLDSTFCSLDSAVVLTPWFSGGTFSGNGISDSIFNPHSAGAGTHIISYSYTNSTGCSYTNSFHTTVYNAPAVSLTGLSTSYCANGESDTLSFSPAGGILSGTAGSGNIFNPGQYPVNSPVTLIYSYTDSAGCFNADTVSTIVRQEPQFGLGADTTACQGDTIMAGVNMTGYIFTWSTGAHTPLLAVDTSLTVAGTAALWLRVSDTATGCSSTDSIVITFESYPVVNITDTVKNCGFSPLTVAAGNSASYAYQWSTGDTTMSLTIDTSMAPALWNPFNVKVTSAAGCSTLKHFTVHFVPLPKVNLGPDTTICINHTLVLHAGSGSGYSYWWTTGDTSENITVKGSDLGTGNHTIGVEVTLEGCMVNDHINIEVLPCTGIATAESNPDLKVYPNPANGEVHLRSGENIISIRIISSSGRIVKSLEMAQKEVRLDVSNLPAGLYHLSVLTNRGMSSKLLTITR